MLSSGIEKAKERRVRNQRRQPIFVVGCPRSGTTLLASFLGAHSRLICGPETEFFTGLQIANRGNRLCRAAAWPDEAASYLFSKVHEKPIPDYYGITREEIIAYLKQRERSCPAILESLTDTYMRRHGKQRWVEKTPTHIMYLHEVRRYYPDAPIVRIVRDPRDVALSLLNVPWGPSSFANAVLLWRRLDEFGASFFGADRNCFTLRFEDLVMSPESELRKVCEFVGEEFEPDMMNASQSNIHVNPTNVPWKQRAGGQLDPDRVAIWQRETSADQQRQAEAIAGDRAKAYGYPTLFQFNRYLEVLNLGNLSDFPTVFESFLDGSTRFWRARPREVPEMRFFLGDPRQNCWIGLYRSTRFATVCRVGVCAARSLTTGIPLIWLGAPPATQRQNWGILCRVLAKLLPTQLEVNAFSCRDFAAASRRL
jgi:Sulfotransferase family